MKKKPATDKKQEKGKLSVSSSASSFRNDPGGANKNKNKKLVPAAEPPAGKKSEKGSEGTAVTGKTGVMERFGNEEQVRDYGTESEDGKEKTLADVMQIEHIRTPLTTEAIIDKRGFQLLEVLGKGGFGVVKRALWTKREDMEVAVKILRLERREKEGKERKGMRVQDVKFEIENMQLLKEHSGIVTLHEYFAVNTDVVIVMELADAKTLMQEVKKAAQVDERKIGRWFWELTDAVNFMHAKGVAHRDLKLDNVLLKKPAQGQAGRRHCRVVDFGLSRRCFSPTTGITLMRGHAGTRPYMAPEIVAYSVDKEHASRYNPMSCDVWALGVCLYCMLTKSYPFERVDTPAALAHMRDEGARMSRIGNKEVRDLVRAMLEPIPAKRITTRGILSHKWAVDNNGVRK